MLVKDVRSRNYYIVVHFESRLACFPYSSHRARPQNYSLSFVKNCLYYHAQSIELELDFKTFAASLIMLSYIMRDSKHCLYPRGRSSYTHAPRTSFQNRSKCMRNTFSHGWFTRTYSKVLLGTTSSPSSSPHPKHRMELRFNCREKF